MENPEATSLAERAYQRLRSEILYGDLMPGERLRPADLQDKFQLGLTPIREALMRLSSENLVALDTNRGSRVSETSPAELSDLMATRRSIESLCLTSAMAHGDAAWEAEVVSAMHLLSKTPLPRSAKDREAATLWGVAPPAFSSGLGGCVPGKVVAVVLEHLGRSFRTLSQVSFAPTHAQQKQSPRHRGRTPCHHASGVGQGPPKSHAIDVGPFDGH